MLRRQEGSENKESLCEDFEARHLREMIGGGGELRVLN